MSVPYAKGTYPWIVRGAEKKSRIESVIALITSEKRPKVRRISGPKKSFKTGLIRVLIPVRIAAVIMIAVTLPCRENPTTKYAATTSATAFEKI
jgi:hypothetical protein